MRRQSRLSRQPVPRSQPRAKPRAPGNRIFFFLHPNWGASSRLSAAGPAGMGDAGHSPGNAAPAPLPRAGQQLPCALPAPPPRGENRLRSLPQSPADAEIFPKATGSGSRAAGVLGVAQKHGAEERGGCSPRRRCAARAPPELPQPLRMGAMWGRFLSLGGNLNCSVQPAAKEAKQEGWET